MGYRNKDLLLANEAQRLTQRGLESLCMQSQTELQLEKRKLTERLGYLEEQLK